MMTNIHQRHKSFAFVEPDDSNIHVHAELKQVVCSLNALRSKRRMKGVLGKNCEFVFKLLFSVSAKLR